MQKTSQISNIKHKISVPRIVYIVGPTASGKTALSIEVAKRIGAEIVCADSQTVRKGMNIGTAKPTAKEMDGIQHHLLNVVEPYEPFSLHDYLELARATIANILKSGKPVIVVGGTGLYIDALYYDYSLPELPDDTQLQATREAYEALSINELQQQIIDAGLIMPINAQNRRHLINTLLRDGSKGTHGAPHDSSIIVGIRPDRHVLVDRIDRRVEAMFNQGLIEEVQMLLDCYGLPPKQFDAIGYRIIMRYLDGEVSEAEAKELFKIADRQYAKRQMSWFKRNASIMWFEEPEKAKLYLLEQFE